jgi:hypothetical protein
MLRNLDLVEHTIDAWIRPETAANPFSGIVVKQNADNTGRNYYLGIMSDRRAALLHPCGRLVL